MSRVFLVSTNTTVEPYPVYPLGMATVAAALVRCGHEVAQFDHLAAGCSDAVLKEALVAFRPDVVGLSLRNIDNVNSCTGESAWYLGAAKSLLAGVRAVTAAPVVLGGPAFSIMPEEILDYLGADYGIAGEGERAFPYLLQLLADGKKAPRILAPGIALAGGEMGAALRQADLVAYYQNLTGIVNVQSKRGCPYSCNYCSYPHLEGNFFRHREPAAVVEEMLQTQKDHGVDFFFFTDSVFNDPEGRYLEIAECLLGRQSTLHWSAFFRPQGMGRGEIRLLKRAGLQAMELGTDAASDVTLAGIGKGFAFADAAAVNRAAVAEGVPCAHFVIFGGPGETPATLREGLANLAALESCVVFAFSGIRVFPGTALLELARRQGQIASGDSLLKPVYYFSPAIERQRMNDTITQAFHQHRDRVFPPAEGQKRLQVMQRFGFRGLLWDKLVSFPSREPEAANKV